MGLLSWLTRNGDGSRGVTDAGTRADADAGTTTPGPDTAPYAPAAAGWRSAPPVQRTLSAPMGLLTDPRGFGGRLGTWQDPTVTGPLGHLVSAQAPSGVGHGLAELALPVQRTGVRPQAHPPVATPDAPEPAQAWADEPGAAPSAAPGAGDRPGGDGGFADRPGEPHGTGGTADPVVLRSPSPAGGTSDGLRVVAPAPLPQLPPRRTAVPSAGPEPDTAPPVMVMRTRSVPPAPVPTRPLVAAEPPDVPAWELAAVPAALPDAGPGPLAPGTPDGPVAGLLAESGPPGPPVGQGEPGGVVQRTEAPVTGRPTAPDTAALPLPHSLPLAVPHTGTAAGRGPDTAPTAPLIGGADGAGPAVPPAAPPAVGPAVRADVQRDVRRDVRRDVPAPPRPRHRGLGEPLAALPPTALPLPGPTTSPAPPTGSAPPAEPPSAPAVAHVSRSVEVPEPTAAPDGPYVPHAPEPPTVPDLAAGPGAPGAPSPDGEVTAPLLGDTPPLTPDPVALGTGPSPEPATGAGADLAGVDIGPVSVRGTAPAPGAAPRPGPGPDSLPGPVAGAGDAASPGPVAVQRLDALADSPQPSLSQPSQPSQPSPPPSTGATPALAEPGRAPLLGEAGPLVVSDTVVLEAPGPGELVTATTPLPMRRLDTVDEAALPGTAPEAGAGAAARGGGPVFPLVAQRSLPLCTVPEPFAEAPVPSEPPAAVPVRWEPVRGAASASAAGGSAGRARSADAVPDGFGPPGGPGGSPGGRGHPGDPGGVSGPAGGVVQRAADAGAQALADAAPPARSHGGDGRPGGSGLPGVLGLPGPAEFTGVSALPGLSGLSGLSGVLAPGGPADLPGGPSAVAAFPDGAPRPAGRAPHGPDALGPAVPLQRLGTVPGTDAPPAPHPTPTAPLPPPLRGQAPSASVPPGDSAGAAAVAAGVARWMPDGSVEFTAPAVQRAEDGPPGADPPTDAPAQPEPAGPPEPPAAADGGPAPAAAPGKAGVPKVTDELVRALVAPLSRLLKAELRIERERAGTFINTRH